MKITFSKKAPKLTVRFLELNKESEIAKIKKIMGKNSFPRCNSIFLLLISGIISKLISNKMIVDNIVFLIKKLSLVKEQKTKGKTNAKSKIP